MFLFLVVYSLYTYVEVYVFSLRIFLYFHFILTDVEKYLSEKMLYFSVFHIGMVKEETEIN